MTNLTKKDIEQLLGKRIDPLAKTLHENTAVLHNTTAVAANLAKNFREFREEMKNVPSILDNHTTTLDAIFKNTEHWKTEAAALRSAIKRHEQWITQIAQKLGMELES